MNGIRPFMPQALEVGGYLRQLKKNPGKRTDRTSPDAGKFQPRRGPGSVTGLSRNFTRVETSRRRDNLGWSHHREVAALGMLRRHNNLARVPRPSKCRAGATTSPCPSPLSWAPGSSRVYSAMIASNGDGPAAFSLVMEKEGLSFIEAVERLAGEASRRKP
jgi:hypothetical protein